MDFATQIFTNDFVLVTTTDLHGALAEETLLPATEPYGLAYFATHLEKLRQGNEVFYVDNGDTFQGSTVSSLATSENQSEFMPTVLDSLGALAFNLGNHEFNEGASFLRRYLDDMRSCNIHCLTMNISLDGAVVGRPLLLERSDTEQKILILGVVTTYLPHWETPENLVGIEILPIEATIRQTIDAFQGGVDQVVVFYHGGFECDLDSGKPIESLTGENIGYKLVRNLPEVSLWVTGHQHRTMLRRCGDALVAQSGSNCCCWNTFQFSDTGVDGQMHLARDFVQNAAWLKLHEKPLRIAEEWQTTVIGHGLWSEETMLVPNGINRFFTKPAMTTWFNQVSLQLTGADVAAIHLDEIAPGLTSRITNGSIKLNNWFDNYLVVKRMSGKNLRLYLEQCAMMLCLDEVGRYAITERFLTPKRQLFNYDFFDGIEYAFDVSKPEGSRVCVLKRCGGDVADNDTLLVAVSSYRAAGGGDFASVVESPTVKKYDIPFANMLRQYIMHNSPINFSPMSNFRLHGAKLV